MSEWWTYTLSDFLLFSPRTYYRLIELYNVDIWPAQILALALGGAILALIRQGDGWRGRVIAAIFAAAWLWVGWAFHYQRYATINWAATYFAGGFLLEALLLLWVGVVRARLVVAPSLEKRQRAGLCIFAFALIVQPLIGPLTGRAWTQIEIAGVAPDPTAVATLGILLLAARRMPWGLLVIPVLWCAVSGALLWTMAAPEAIIMWFAALLVPILAAATMQSPLARNDPS